MLVPPRIPIPAPDGPALAVTLLGFALGGVGLRVEEPDGEWNEDQCEDEEVEDGGFHGVLASTGATLIDAGWLGLSSEQRVTKKQQTANVMQTSAV